MASNLIRSPELILREAEEKRKSKNRFDDLCLVLKQKSTGTILLSSGGRWDNIDRRYLDTPAPRACIVDIEESQVPYLRWFSRWLNAYVNDAPRATRAVLTAGRRRGGKTTVGVISALALLVSKPNQIVWVVSPSYEKRDEIDVAIKQFFPSSWYVYKGSPKFRYIFNNGSVLRHVSGDDPEILKQGRADLVLLNEAQLMDSRALTNALPGTIDRGGITILAANPATRSIGIWVNDLKEAIDIKKVQGVKFFDFDPNLNTSIDQKAREDIGAIVRVVDPKVAAADDEGLWLPVGDVAYAAFRTVDHVKPAPSIGECTADVLRKKLGRGYDYLNGFDPQYEPHNAGISLKIYRDHLTGQLIYWGVGEILRQGTEDDFLDTVDDAGIWTPENTVWIYDASSTWQNYNHTKGRVSADILKSRRWHCHPPQKAKDEKRNPSNPDVEDRLNLVNRLLASKRLFVDGERCPRLAIALKKCELKNHKPRGKYAHITDALGYALWFIEPKPKANQPNSRGSIWTVPGARRNTDF